MFFTSRHAHLTLVLPNNRAIQFEDGLYETKNRKEVGIIKNHPQFGITIFAAEEKKVEETVNERTTD